MTHSWLSLIIALAFASLAVTDGIAQKQDTSNVQQSTRVARSDSVKIGRAQDNDSPRIVADSTRDRRESARTPGSIRIGKLPNQTGRGRDQFIDRNGDGICDGRESALGLKKMYRLRKGRMNASR